MRSIAVFPTLTAAQRAQRLLSAAAIPSEVVKVDASRTRHGCSWGTAFSSPLTDRAAVTLHNAALYPGEIIPEFSGR